MWHRWSLVIGVMLPGDGPLAVVGALLRPLQVVSDKRPQRAAPPHICMRQQGEGAQLTPRLPRQKIIRRPRHDDCPRRHPSGFRLSTALRGLARPLGGGGGWRGGGRGRAGVERGRGFGGVGGELAPQGITLLLEALCCRADVRRDAAFRLAGGGLLEMVCDVR